MTRSFAAIFCLLGIGLAIGAAKKPAEPPAFQETFPVDPADLVSTGRNPYFILEPGYTLYFTGREGSARVDLRIAVLAETMSVAGVETRVVEERETANGSLREVSRNYFAISRATADVYYFGEEVDLYKHGKIVSHEGSWLAGQGTNRFGLAMPAAPRIGQRYYQEIAPKVAMDRAEVVSLTGTMKTPAGTFDRVLKIEETTPREPGVKEYKSYAPEIGLIRDGGLRLERYGPNPGQ
jgi:hypothetical protein